MKHLTIKAKLALMCTMLAAAAAIFALSVALYNEQRMVELYFRDSLAAAAQLAYDDVRSNEGELEIDRNLDDLPNVRVALYTLDGDLIYGQQRFELPLEEGGMRQAQSRGGEEWVVQDSVMHFEDASSVYLRCYMSADAMYRIRGIRREVLLALFPALIILAALGGWLVARRAFRPVQRIIRTAEGIADGTDLQKRIALSGARDEIYQTAQVFDAMLDRLELAFERERRFTADASHELRTPVMAIMAQSEMALAVQASESDRLEALAEIHRQSGRMAVLIQRLLALARLDARRGLDEREMVDLGMVAEAAAELLQERAAQKGMSISAEGGAVVWGDQTMLTQAALNLVENAVNYGREAGHIRIAVRCDDRQVRFSVADDGPGISAEHQGRIFDRFYQADASRHNSGFGLGLSLVQRIAQLHGGRVALSSAPGKGSCFEMVFPREKGDANG